MLEDSLLIDIVYKKNLVIRRKDMIVHILTRDGLAEALERHDRFAPHQEAVLSRALDLGTFKGELGNILLDIPDRKDRPVHIYVGLGARGELNSRIYQNAGALLARRVAHMNIHSMILDLAVPVNLEPVSSIKPFVEGIAIGSYTFSKYFRERKPFPLGNMTVVIPDYMDAGNARTALIDAAHNIQASNISRHLTNEASNNKTPALFESLIYENLSNTSLLLHTMQEKELQKENLNLLRAVGQAGSDTPRMIILEDIRLDRPFCLGIVGKAVTFDAGGLMLKSPESLPLMRDDVAGAAAVIGAMSVIRSLNLDYNVVCAIPIAENMLDAKAYRPADVFETRWNISVEVTNTDSEGRLMMADAFMYLQDNYPLNALVDVATLTGAVARALGNQMSGYFTNDARMQDLIEQAQLLSREKFWRLPLEQAYRNKLKSAFADIRNEGGDPKGITAALFLETFIRKNLPWMHIDLGRVVTPGDDDPLYGNPEYTTGIPAMTLIEFLRLLNLSLDQFGTHAQSSRKLTPGKTS
jgi:leucyl aminopeptidase